MHPSSGESESRVGDEFNRGIFQIIIPAPALSGEVGSRKRMRLVMYVSVDASGSMQETATRRGQAAQTKMDFVHMTLTNMIEYKTTNTMPVNVNARQIPIKKRSLAISCSSV